MKNLPPHPQAPIVRVCAVVSFIGFLASICVAMPVKVDPHLLTGAAVSAVLYMMTSLSICFDTYTGEE